MSKLLVPRRQWCSRVAANPAPVPGVPPRAAASSGRAAATVEAAHRAKQTPLLTLGKVESSAALLVPGSDGK